MLANGSWYKIAVAGNGMYKLDASALSGLGINTAGIDPEKIKIYGNGGGMLPQTNDSIRPVGLTENAIKVVGGEDGSFDNGDYVIFYGEGPDYYAYTADSIYYQTNIYDRQNYYFLTVNGAPGLRVGEGPDLGHGHNLITVGDDFLFHEVNTNNLLTSGRKWYGEIFDVNTQHSFSYNLPNRLTDREIEIRVSVMAQSFSPCSFDVAVNGTTVGNVSVESVPDYNQSGNRYAVKGKEAQKVLTALSNSENLNITFNFNKGSSGRSVGYLDHFIIEFKNTLSYNNEALFFRSKASRNNAINTYNVNNVGNNVMIWNITNRYVPSNQVHANGTFGASGNNQIQEFVAFTEQDLLVPELIGSIPNQNIRNLSQPDLLIVTNSDFLPQAQQLAAFRSSNDNLATHVVTLDQIYNEFSSGKQDVSAIRDFTKHLYNKGSRLKYLLLFGKGSYDYQDRISDNTNKLPVYESRNSLHPLYTYASDDFYGFMENDEGLWEEMAGGNHTLDIGVGRLPVSTTQEATNVVNKLISYSNDKKNYGKWRNNIVFVADDGDNNTHQGQADDLAKLIDTSYVAFNADKLYLDAFKQEPRPSGEISPEASAKLTEKIDEGALIVNYTGHGGEVGWMQEQVLTVEMIQSWKNKNNLPLFVTATCEFGRHDDPRRVSGGELVITTPSGGGIAIVSTSRPVYSTSNFAINKAFYNTVFAQENGEYLRLGDVIRVTKNNSINSASDGNKVGNRNFTLLGDPSLKLAYPEQQLNITGIQQNNIITDTLNAQGKITVTGQVSDFNGNMDTAYNGSLFVEVFDKPSEFKTLGDENLPFKYYQKENVLFRGNASIRNGLFTFGFFVPKNISYQFGNGKISMYAINDEQIIDAHGATGNILIGGSTGPPVDNQGPIIQSYFGDSTNTSTRDIPPNTNLALHLADESGINISGYGLGNSIEAILDDSILYRLNDYYEAIKDNYKEGWAIYPLQNMLPGKHNLTIKAWDVFNNPGGSSIEFYVIDPDKINISQLFNYPNPFSEKTHFRLTHNRSGEDLEVQLQIMDGNGALVKDMLFNVSGAQSTINLYEWDGSSNGEKLQTGIYLFKVKIRSLSDGATTENFKKLILIN